MGRRFVWWMPVVLACGGGGSGGDGGGLPVGRVCSPGDCAAELECLTQLTADEAGVPWCEGESFCTLGCIDDAACVAALGEGHICVQDGCSPDGMCFEGSSG